MARLFESPVLLVVPGANSGGGFQLFLEASLSPVYLGFGTGGAGGCCVNLEYGEDGQNVSFFLAFTANCRDLFECDFLDKR